MSTKICTKCKKVKLLTEFPVYNNKINSHCYQCKRDYNAKHQKTPAGIYQQIKGRNGFYKDHPFLITQSDFINWYINIPHKCVYCDIEEKELYLWKKIVGGRFRRLTVDCKENKIGYVKGNLVLACDKCNLMKADILTYSEMREIGQKYVKPKWLNVKNDLLK